MSIVEKNCKLCKTCDKTKDRVFNQAMNKSMDKYKVIKHHIQISRTNKYNSIFLKIFSALQSLAISTYETLDGHTTSKSNKWRLFTIYLGAIVTASVDSWQLYYKKHHGYMTAKLESVAPDAIQSIYDYILYLVDLYHINKYDKEASAEYYKQYYIIDEILGRQANAAINTRLNKLIWLLTVIWSTNVVYTSVCNRDKGIGEVLIYVSYHIFLFTKILTILSLIAHTLRIEYRLRMIGDMVEDCYNMSESWHRINALNEYRRLSVRIYSSICLSNQNRRKRNFLLQPFKIFPYKYYRKITGLSKCYLILLEQCEFVNNMFAIRILMLSLNLTVDMVRFINSTVRYAQGSQYNGVTVPVYSSVVWSAMRTFVPAVIFFSLVHYCERAYKERDRIVRLADHVIVRKNCESDVLAAVTELRALAFSRPISFTAANFFRFEYPIVTTIVATVTNYSIILFQSKS